MIDFAKQYNLLKFKLQNLKGKTLLIIHYDLDGLTSGIIFGKALEKLGYKYQKDFAAIIVKDSYRSDFEKKNETKNFVKSFDNIFFLDYSFDSYTELQNKNVFVIDHHKSADKDVDFIINPASKVNGEGLPSASALAYDFYHFLFGKDSNLKKIAFIGCVSDLMVYPSLPYLHTNDKDSDLFMSNSVLVKTMYFYACTMLTKIYETNSQDQYLFDYLYKNSDNLFGFFVYSQEHQKIIESAIKKELKDTESLLANTEINIEKNILWLEIPPQDKTMKKDILGILEIMYPELTKIIYIEHTNKYACSVRSTKIDSVKLIGHLKQTFPDMNGGGHPFAAGFTIPKESFELAKQKILEFI